MTFKVWINSLPLANLMVLARQVGFKGWKTGERRQCGSFLIKSPEAKQLFTDFKLGNIRVPGKPDYVSE